MAWTAPKTDWKVTYGPDGEYTGDFFNVEGELDFSGGISQLS